MHITITSTQMIEVWLRNRKSNLLIGVSQFRHLEWHIFSYLAFWNLHSRICMILADRFPFLKIDQLHRPSDWRFCYGQAISHLQADFYQPDFADIWLLIWMERLTSLIMIASFVKFIENPNTLLYFQNMSEIEFKKPFFKINSLNSSLSSKTNRINYRRWEINKCTLAVQICACDWFIYFRDELESTS